MDPLRWEPLTTVKAKFSPMGVPHKGCVGFSIPIVKKVGHGN